MNIIEEIAKEFVEEKYGYYDTSKEFLDLVKSELARLGKTSDKLIFVSVVRNLIVEELNRHNETCKNPKECYESKAHLKTLYYLDVISSEYGKRINVDEIFSENEKRDYDIKLDKIISEMENLKKGQEIIYDDLLNELEELKNLYFLGKRNWKQLLAGKTVEMVASGVISETISKRLINLTDIATQNLLK